MTIATGIEAVWHDLRDGGRSLRKNPGFAQDFRSVWSIADALVEGDEPESLRFGLVTANSLPLRGAPRASTR